MTRKKKSGKAGVPGLAEGRSELSNVLPQTGITEQPPPDNESLPRGRDDQVSSPHPTSGDEIVPGVTASRDDSGASSGTSLFGTRRGNIAPTPSPSIGSYWMQQMTPMFKPPSNVGSPDPPGMPSYELSPSEITYKVTLEDKLDAVNDPSLGSTRLANLDTGVNTQRKPMYAPVEQDDESKEIDLLLDPVVKHLVTVVLQLNETDSQYQFLEQNGYLRDLISLTDFPITSPMQDRYIPLKESGRFSGDPQYLIRGIALNLQKFRLWVDYVISQLVDKNNVTWTDLGAQDFQDFKLKFVTDLIFLEVFLS